MANKKQALVLGGENWDADTLSKALKAKHSVHYGSWQGLPIIAIGPKGGKIVGYTGLHDPIYAGSATAHTLAGMKGAWEQHKPGKTSLDIQHKAIHNWLSSMLDIPFTFDPVGGEFLFSAENAQKLQDAFGIAPGEHHAFSVHSLLPHIGHPLKPAEHEMLDYGATMAAGDADHPAFPKSLASLKQIPAGQFEGSHGNKLFVAPNGQKYIYKAENPMISRAEETVSRLSRLILGPGKTQDAKYVQLNGQDGVLISVVENAKPLGPEHKSMPPATEKMQKYFADIVGQNVLDWLVSNHDAHGENFLVSNDDKLIAIDKGQAWKFLGQDELDPDYVPNPSAPVYSFFWKQLKAGKLQGDPLPVLQKVFGNISKISSEQFRAIIAPYVSLRAGKEGKSAAEVEKPMLDRFSELRSNWEWFLGKIYPKKAVNGKITIIPDLGASTSVPAMPPAATPEPKLEAPAEKLTIPQKPTPAMATMSPGWPIEKGTVTVMHPGIEKPAAWPGGYPGPGYMSVVAYKGQKFSVSFQVQMGGKMVVSVGYPDGKMEKFDSPNKAADSFYLWANGLNLHMSATEKKAKGISYSATKLFNLKAFEKEFAEFAVEKTTSALTPEELVAKKVVPADAKIMTTHQAYKAHGVGVVIDKSILAPNVQKFLQEHNSDAMIVAVTDTGSTVVSSYYDGDGTPKYHVWGVDSNGEELANFETVKPLPTLAGTTLELKPKPKAVKDPEVPAKVEIPKDAPSPGPLPQGTEITVKKKGIEGAVVLTVLPDGKFQVDMLSQTETFGSLSAASDHVWVVSQGYKNAEDYKKKTGKTKIASGGGWKFWGVKPGQEPKPPVALPHSVSQEAVKVADTKITFGPGSQLLSAKSVNLAWLEEQPIGTKLMWVEHDSHAGYITPVAVKQEGKDGNFDSWLVTWVSDEKTSVLSSSSMKVQMTEAIGDKVAALHPEPPALSGTTLLDPSDPNWDTMPPPEETSWWYDQPVGATIKFIDQNAEPVVAVKAPNEKWIINNLPDKHTNNTISAIAIGALGKKIQVKKTAKPATPNAFDNDATAPGEPNWEWFDDINDLGKQDLAKITQKLKDLPFASSIKFEVTEENGKKITGVPTTTIKATKLGPDTWSLIGSLHEDLSNESSAFIGGLKLNYATSGVKVQKIPAKNAPPVQPDGLLPKVGTQISSKEMDGLPVGTVIAAGDYDYHKTPSGYWKNPILGSEYKASDFHNAVEVKSYLDFSTLSQTVHPSIKGLVKATDEKTKEYLEKIEDAYTETWANTKTADGLHFIGEKPSGWASWVPPPGVWVQGKANGQKVWFTTGSSGYGEEGKTLAMVNFVLVTEDGKGAYIETPVPAAKAEERLDELLKKQFGGGLSAYVFGGFKNNHFPVGATKKTLNYSAFATDAPKVVTPEEVKGSPTDLKGAAAAQPVAATLDLQDGWNYLEEVKKYGTNKLKLKPGANANFTNICLDNIPGMSAQAQIDVIKALAAKLGLTPAFPGHPKANSFGAFASFHTEDIQKAKVPVTVPASALPPSPSPAPKLAVGMAVPEVHTIEFLNSLPEGTLIGKHGVGLSVYQKAANGDWTVVGETSSKFQPIDFNGVGGFEIKGLPQVGKAETKPLPAIGTKVTLPSAAFLDPLPVGTVIGSTFYDYKKLEHGNWIHPASGTEHPPDSFSASYTVKSYPANAAQPVATHKVADIIPMGQAGENILNALPVGSKITYDTGVSYEKLTDTDWKETGTSAFTTVAKHLAKAANDSVLKISHIGGQQPKAPEYKIGDVVPKGDEGKKTLNALPVGTTISFVSGASYTKSDAGWHVTGVPNSKIWAAASLVSPPTKMTITKLPMETPDNFETMPETESAPGNHPTKIYKTWPVQKKLDALKALPDGATITLSTGVVWTKSGSYWNSPSYDGASTLTVANKIAAYNGGIVTLPKGGKTTVAASIPKAATPEPVAPKWVAPPPDPKAEEKKAWAKKHPALDAEQTKHLSWWLHKSGLSNIEIYARQTPAGNLLLGDGTPEFGKHFDSKVAVETPHGTLFAVGWKQIKEESPEATMIKGPDGAPYPHGTTFETEKIYKPLKDLLPQEQGFTKLSPYKGPDADKYQKTVKVMGTTPAHKAMAEAIVKKYNLDTPVLQGQSNTLFFISDKQLEAKAGEPELKVVAKVPPQPPMVKLKGVGAALGVANEGQPAPINRDDLSNVDSIIPFRQGYSIRFGEGGVLMDGQLRMHRVQLPNGPLVHRFVGELTKNTPGLKESNQFHFYNASSQKNDPFFGGKWKEHDYDPKTGVTTMSADECWEGGTHYSSGADLSGNASLHVFNSNIVTLRRTFVVDVPVGVNPEQALSEAMTILGMPTGAAMKHPDEQDERIMKKIQILRSYKSGSGFDAITAMHLMEKDRDAREAQLDKALAQHVEKKYVDSARVVIGHDGFHHVELDDIDHEIGSNVKAAITGISVEGIVRAVLHGGYGGQAQCLFNGNSRNLDSAGPTASGSQDMMSGGGYGRFFSMINANVNSVSAVGQSKPKLVVHPRVYKKTNWYAANSDTYGSQSAGSSYGRTAALNLSGTSNEVMIENVSARDFVGAIVQTDQDKASMIAYFQKAGLTEINGCPLDKFVVVGSVSNNLKGSLAKLPLLKE